MRREHTIDLIFVLVLVLIFTISLLLVLSSGAMSYKRTSETLESHYQERSCLSYIAVKIRSFDMPGAVGVSEFAGSDALCLYEVIDEVEYVTRIYHYDGKVLELFSRADVGLAPSMGQEIIPANGLRFDDMGGGLIHAVCIGEGGREAEIFFALRSVVDGEERGV